MLLISYRSLYIQYIPNLSYFACLLLAALSTPQHWEVVLLLVLTFPGKINNQHLNDMHYALPKSQMKILNTGSTFM